MVGFAIPPRFTPANLGRSLVSLTPAMNIRFCEVLRRLFSVCYQTTALAFLSRRRLGASPERPTVEQ